MNVLFGIFIFLLVCVLPALLWTSLLVKILSGKWPWEKGCL